jgi:hypothetical protein
MGDYKHLNLGGVAKYRRKGIAAPEACKIGVKNRRQALSAAADSSEPRWLSIQYPR